LFEVPPERRQAIEDSRRSTSIVLTHRVHGEVTITDNRPLSMSVLARCLDDNLTPEAWLRMLNSRVFFWASEGSVARLVNAALHRDREKAVLVFRTASLLERCAAQVELSAINSGATVRSAPRRGLTTFVPMSQHSYESWRRLRGKRDTVKEVTVIEGVHGIDEHLMEVRQVRGTETI
jgi:hypothetical protein